MVDEYALYGVDSMKAYELRNEDSYFFNFVTLTFFFLVSLAGRGISLQCREVGFFGFARLCYLCKCVNKGTFRSVECHCVEADLWVFFVLPTMSV